MRIRTLAVVFAVLAAAACDQPAEPANAPAAPAARAFSYAATSDLSGFYIPLSEVRIGKWSFDHLFISQAADF